MRIPEQPAHIDGERNLDGEEEPPPKPEPLEELRLSYPSTEHMELLGALSYLGRKRA